MPTAAFCRAQEAAQLQRAANEPLENVRRIARAAAQAWNVEALWAESRESGHVAIPRLRLSAQEQQEDQSPDAAFSDKLDRSVAND